MSVSSIVVCSPAGSQRPNNHAEPAKTYCLAAMRAADRHLPGFTNFQQE
jgi:hypothetical protein